MLSRSLRLLAKFRSGLKPGNDFSLEVESTDNVIRNLSIKGGGVIFLKENGNLVEKIWMGLTKPRSPVVDGMAEKPFLRAMTLRTVVWLLLCVAMSWVGRSRAAPTSG